MALNIEIKGITFLLLVALIVMGFMLWWSNCGSGNSNDLQLMQKNEAIQKVLDSSLRENETKDRIAEARIGNLSGLLGKKEDTLQEAKKQLVYYDKLLQGTTVKSQQLANQILGSEIQDTICTELANEVTILNKQFSFYKFSCNETLRQWEEKSILKDSIIIEERGIKQRAVEQGYAMAKAYSTLFQDFKKIQPRSAVYAGFAAAGNQYQFLQAFGLGATLVTKNGQIFGGDAMMMREGSLLVQVRYQRKIK